MALSTDPTTQDALSMIVQSYNKDEPPDRKLNDIDFVFEAPTVVTNPAESTSNTRIKAKPLAGSGNYGVAKIYYDRLDLNELTDRPAIVRDGNTTLADIVAQLNEEYGINLVPADYVAGANITGPTVTIVAQATSWLFRGQIELTFAD